MKFATYALAALLPAVALALPAAAAGENARPNILFIFSDDHAYQAISAYGSNRNVPPNLDFAQTFLDIAGVKDIPEPMQGASLVPIFKGQTPPDWRKSFYYHYYEFPGAHSVQRHYGGRMGDHKLIHY